MEHYATLLYLLSIKNVLTKLKYLLLYIYRDNILLDPLNNFLLKTIIIIHYLFP